MTRHVNQCQLTLDGNFQTNKMKKNGDPADVLLVGGHVYFPKAKWFKSLLGKVQIDSADEVPSKGLLIATNG